MDRVKRFFMCFRKEMEACELSVYQNGGSKFTEYVTAVVRRIVEEEFDLCSGKEYFRIDITGWKDRKDEIKEQAIELKMNPHLWDLCIAVEHENALLDWTDEVIKLVHIRCPLKVIIGYNHCDCREENDEEKLSMVASWMTKVGVFSQKERETYLIILGNGSSLASKEKPDIFDYRGYVFDYDSASFWRL